MGYKYFAIFDGHAGTFAADWCGKKLHIILEELIRKNPNTPIPELLDQTGAALTNLRPSGIALINGRRVDVVTEGSLIERGTPVKVIAIDGHRPSEAGYVIR